MFRNIYVIVNPAAGKKEPIVSYLNDVLHPMHIKWEVLLTKKLGDAYTLTKKALKKKADLVAVYGGDGTIREASKALFKNKTPLLILPGGTANVMAKELGITGNTQDTIKLIINPKTKIKKVDMGIIGKDPFLIRVNFGIPAAMVTSANRELKNTLGQVAYGVTAIKHIVQQDSIHYVIDIDGKKISTDGVGLIVANSGNIGIPEVSLLPTISVVDGKLDVILIKTADIQSLITWAHSTITGTKPKGLIRHWKGKKISVQVQPKQGILLDDVPLNVKRLDMAVVPKALNVLMPK